MSGFYLAAGIITALAVPIHIWGGEYTLHRTPTEAFPTIPNGDSSVAKQELRFGWHMASVDLFLACLLLLLLALTNVLEPSVTIARIVALYFLGYSLVIAVVPAVALRSWRSLVRMPQWLLALRVATLAFLGSL